MILTNKNGGTLPSSANPAGTLTTPPTPSTPVPLSSRPADFLYFCFFVCHIPITLILDLQAIYPKWLLSEDSMLRALGTFYTSMTRDPVVGGVSGFFGPTLQHHFLWLWCFMWTEMLIQLPTFIYGAYSLYYNINITTLYPLLIFYGAGTAFTTLPCLAVLLTTPSTGHIVDALQPTLSAGQRALLLGSYVPFLLIPLIIAIDMAFRTKRLATIGLAVLHKQTTKWD